MTKTNNKLKEVVGEAIGHPHFEGISKKEKGITLIALIITIIIMLILVAVTLNIALGENGIVHIAKEAKESTTREKDREKLLSIVVGAIGIDGKVDFEKLARVAGAEGFTVNEDGTYTSENGNTFTVSEDGKITYNGGNNQVAFNWESVNLNVDTNTEYLGDDGLILNFAEDGKLTILSSGVIVATIDATNPDNIKDGNINCLSYIDGADTIVKLEMNENNIDIDTTLILIQENGTEGKPWTVTCEKTIVDNKTTYANEEVLKALGITNNTGTYRGTWTVIGTENGNTKLVTTTPAACYVLGYEDPKAIEAISIAGTVATEEEKLQRSMWSYKNAVTSLNTAAQEATGIAVARSIEVEDIYDIIGEENLDKETEYGEAKYGTVYNYYYNADDSKVYSKYQTGTDTWSEPYNTGYSSQTFVDNEGKTVVVDSVGDEVTLTYSYYHCELTGDQKEKMGILASDYYWLASPFVSCHSTYASFQMYYMLQRL